MRASLGILVTAAVLFVFGFPLLGRESRCRTRH